MQLAVRPDIYEYGDFRTFLNDLFEWKHSAEPAFTKATICRYLGLPNSRSYFQDIVNGKKLTATKIPYLMELFEMSQPEGEYFRALVAFNQASSDPGDREHQFARLVALNRSPKKIISSAAYTYYREWYHPVIRAVLNVLNFKDGDSVPELAHKIFPKVTEAQVRKSLALLFELGLIAADVNGFLKPTDRSIATAPQIRNEVLRQYQVSCLETAKLAMSQEPKLSRRMMTKMLSISEDCRARIEQRMEQFNEELSTIVLSDSLEADRVYQFDMVFFPHTEA